MSVLHSYILCVEANFCIHLVCDKSAGGYRLRPCVLADMVPPATPDEKAWPHVAPVLARCGGFEGQVG